MPVIKPTQVQIPNIPPMIQLHNYQQFCKDFALTHPYCGLFLRMGLGKTLITLETLYELNPHCHVLIIAPKTIARCTWQNEINKWNMPFRTKSLVVNEREKDLSKKKREEIYDSIPNNPYATIYFINRDIIPSLVKRFPGNQWPFPIVIIDESQSFKSHSSQRFKSLASVRPYIQRLIELTGSPAPNGLMDLWAQIYLLDMGQRLGRNITTYRNTYFDPGLMKDGYPITWRLKKYLVDSRGFPMVDAKGQLKQAKDVIYEQISDIVISMDNSFITLPPISYHDVDVILTPDELDTYKQFAKSSVLELTDGTIIEAKNAAILASKLVQIASGSIYTNPAKHEYQVIHENKLEMCEYIINNFDSNMLIAYHFQSEKDMLLKYFAKRKIPAVCFDGSAEMQKNWNNKQYPVMLLQPASCGFGVNLQQGGHGLIWYTIPYSLEEYEQTIARIYRQGQTDPTAVFHLLAKQTSDKRLLAVMTNKDATQKDLLKAVQVSVDEL